MKANSTIIDLILFPEQKEGGEGGQVRGKEKADKEGSQPPALGDGTGSTGEKIIGRIQKKAS